MYLYSFKIFVDMSVGFEEREDSQSLLGDKFASQQVCELVEMCLYTLMRSQTMRCLKIYKRVCSCVLRVNKYVIMYCNP